MAKPRLSARMKAAGVTRLDPADRAAAVELPLRLRRAVARAARLDSGGALLFAGESGTGKTMAARVLAGRVERELYRVDLAAVVSKYIGETTKNLKKIFAAAEKAGAILLLDEADAVFGKRSEVKDAHDRYANMEVAYLLQLMEGFSGISILTTNRRQNIDKAFMRRMNHIIQFARPGE